MYQILRPLLFRLDPERVHGLTVQALRFSGAFAPLRWLLAHQFCAHSHESEIGNFSKVSVGDFDGVF
ncbi:MAG: hypothetical protein ACK2T5_17330, partial [Anaerolineales bacterium]